MRSTRWTLVAVVVTCAALAAAAFAASRASAPAGKPSRTALVARGEYLVNVMGCGDCHTPGTLFGSPDHSRKLSGSELGWRGPWGVSYARNLTPDTDTGLGYWSEKELFNALRTGVKPDGKVLLPPMPWPNTAVLSDADLNAVVAFLQSLSPVKHAVPNAVAPDRAAAITGSIIDMPAPSAWDAPRPVDTGGTQK